MIKKLLLVAFPFLALVNSSSAMTIFINAVNDVCSQGSGKVWVQEVMGFPPFTYLWSTNATTDSIYGLSAGTYTVTVTDGNNNTATASATIVNNSQLSLYSNYSYVTCGLPWMHPCPNTCNGAIGYCYYIGGTPPYNVTSSFGTP
ncbi:MAG TPA: hypothetical protein VKB95_02055, partial [Chitinophagaceae bacterium]|nr:hypothetical protein [Chitinophagaceae bacterium]